VFAGAQKNIGCAGVTVVIVRDDLMGHSAPQVPSIWNYEKQVSMESCLNTPPTFRSVLLLLVLCLISGFKCLALPLNSLLGFFFQLPISFHHHQNFSIICLAFPLLFPNIFLRLPFLTVILL